MNRKNTTFLRNGFGGNVYANLGSCKSIVLKDKIFIVKIQHLLKDEKCIETFVTLNNACNPKWCLWMFRITCICIVFNKQLSFVTIVIKLRAAIKLVLKTPDMYLALHPPDILMYVTLTIKKWNLNYYFSLYRFCVWGIWTRVIFFQVSF